MNPIFIEVDQIPVNICKIIMYRKSMFHADIGVEVLFDGQPDFRVFRIDINEFKAKIDEALAKNN